MTLAKMTRVGVSANRQTTSTLLESKLMERPPALDWLHAFYGVTVAVLTVQNANAGVVQVVVY